MIISNEYNLYYNLYADRNPDHVVDQSLTRDTNVETFRANLFITF